MASALKCEDSSLSVRFYDCCLGDLMQIYFVACAVMGLGIGFDVVLATLSLLRYVTGKAGLTWVRRITATHIIFPMIGYYVFIGLFQSFPRLRVILGIVAFALVAYFLFDLVKKWLTDKGEEIEGDPFRWERVLAVSWDALFSGPAKSAQAIGWSKPEVLFSFFISGLVVTALALGALTAAYFMGKLVFSLLKSSLTGMTILHLAMMYIEFVVLAYFGILAFLRYSLSSEWTMLEVSIIAMLAGAILFMFFGKALFSRTRARLLLTLNDAANSLQTRSTMP